MKGFVTIQEAVRITKTSESTVRRWLRQLNVHEQKNVRRSGRQIFIERSFLLNSFQVEQVETLSEYTPEAYTQSADLSKLLQRQQDTIDKLLQDNARKDDDLKNAWSLITKLKEEAKQLTHQIKTLSQPDHSNDRNDLFIKTAIIVQIVFLAVVLVFMFLT